MRLCGGGSNWGIQGGLKKILFFAGSYFYALLKYSEALFPKFPNFFSACYSSEGKKKLVFDYSIPL